MFSLPPPFLFIDSFICCAPSALESICYADAFFLFCLDSIKEDLPVTVHGLLIGKDHDSFDLALRKSILHRLKDDVQFLPCQLVCVTSDAFHNRSLKIPGIPRFFTCFLINLVYTVRRAFFLPDVLRFLHM